MVMLRDEADRRSIIKVLVGSQIHGLSVPTSDRDIEAVVIEPIHEAIGISKPFEELICESDEEDIKYVSLRKWCRLALGGNPNFLLLLFAPQDNILSMDARGSQLRDLRAAFLSKVAIRAHLGYMQQQRKAVSSKSNSGRGKPRQDLITKYGYDTKFAMHLCRLGLQGCELAEHGRITLPFKGEEQLALMNIRNGLCSLAEVMAFADGLEDRMCKAWADSPLPMRPDKAAVEKWMLEMYVRSWAAERTSMDIREDAARFAARESPSGVRACE